MEIWRIESQLLVMCSAIAGAYREIKAVEVDSSFWSPIEHPGLY